MLPQFREEHEPRYEDFRAGARLLLTGFFKKLVVADRLSAFVKAAYANPGTFDGATLALATAFFAFQIYADFSGYTDIALGSARILGFRLCTNFRNPYLASSVRDFWQRWHISLSTWFRDYLYKPLGGNRKSFARWQLNLLVTFLVSGFWHGANWTFVIWGGMNGLYLVAGNLIERLVPQKAETSFNPFRICRTFVLICSTWIFFRAETLADGLRILKGILALLWSSEARSHSFEYVLSAAGGAAPLKITLLAVALLLMLDLVTELQSRQFLRPTDRLPIWIRWPVYQAALLAILIFGVFTQQTFLYFQF